MTYSCEKLQIFQILTFEDTERLKWVE